MAEEDTFSTTKRTCCANCVKLEERGLKLKKSRDVLRSAFQSFEPKIIELHNEIANLKKAYEVERARAEFENEEKERESSARAGLEKEIFNLKSEIASLRQDSTSRDLDDDCEVILLRERVSELDGEIYRLKELLEEQRQKGGVEQNGIPKESAVGGDSLEKEMLKSEEDCFQKSTATIDQGEESEVILLRVCVSEGQAEISRLNDLIAKEKKNIALEKEKLEADKRKAQEALKIEVEARSKECSVRAGLEDEILNLKSKIDLLKEKSNTSRDQQEIAHLQAHLAEADAESNRLKELFNEGRKRADSEKKKAKAEKKKAEAKKIETEAKIKESACLENEIKKLKSEMATLQEKKDSREEDGETLLLRSCVSKGEAENKRLNELLVKERKRWDSEKKRAEMEKKKCSDALELVKSERRKAKEEKRLADVERTCAEKCRISLEATRVEANELRGKLVSERLRIEEAHKRAEAEKQMAYREKKRAESEIVKAAEQKKFVEEEKKKLMDEKDRTKNLSQKLEEAGQRIESLEKDIQKIMLARTMKQNLPITSEVSRNVGGNLLLLEEQLRLEKMQAKHAKRVSKFEKKRNNLLGQEHYRLKQDFGYFCYRLNELDGCFSNGIEGIDVSAKRNNSLKIKSSNETDKFSGKEPFSLYGKSKNEHVKARYTSVDWFDRFRSTVECSTPLSGASGSSTKPISGISSTLESLIRGSVRNKLQNSAICSTSTSLSDRPLVGSQENNTLNTPRPDSLVENLKTGPGVPSERGKLLINENNGLVAESCARTPLYRDIEDPSLRLNKHDGIKDIGKETGPKRKRLPDELGSVECLCTELPNLPTQIEETVTPPNNALTLENNMPPICSHIKGLNAFGDGRCPTALLLGDIHSRNHRSSKKGKVSENQNSILEPANKIDVYEQAANLQTEITKGGGNFNQTVLQTYCIIETIERSRDTIDTSGINKKAEESIEKMSSEDIMKLLELDDPDDEEKFWMAMEMPLSPTLPEIVMPNMEAFEVDASLISVEGTTCGMTKEINTMVHPGCFSALNVSRDSNKLNFESSGNSHCSVLPQLEAPQSAIGEFPSKDVGFDFRADAGNGIRCEVSEANIELKMTKDVSRSEVMEAPCTSSKERIHERTSKYFVAFANSKDINSICRIITAQKTCLHNSVLVSEKVWMVQNILVALVKEKDLLPEEKACVFFSLLLHNFVVVTSENLGKFAADDIYSCSNSFLTCMRTVIADAGMRNILLELFRLDTLLTLIESFLIDKRVMVYNNVEPHVQCDSESIALLDGTLFLLSSEAATTDKLVAGSVILASICATTGHIGFICEASYKFLQAHRSDSYLTLTVLHVFAFLCGDKYFTLNSHSLIMAVVRSIVTFLEKGTVAIDATCGSYIRLGSEGRLTFSPCAQCLFSKSVLSVDEVLILLLEKLQFCDGIEPDFHASFSMNKNLRLGTSQSDYVDGSISQQLEDVFSLVELLAYYMDWKWTCSKIIPQLIKIVGSCASEKVSTAVILLIGQLGRFGIDRSGCEQLGVEEVRCSLAVFLNQKTTRNWGRPTQYAVVHALIGLLSVNFEELVENKDISVDSSQLIYGNLLRAWFSQLSEEQKSSSHLILSQY